jgi:hypothetical protein
MISTTADGHDQGGLKNSLSDRGRSDRAPQTANHLSAIKAGNFKNDQMYQALSHQTGTNTS